MSQIAEPLTVQQSLFQLDAKPAIRDLRNYLAGQVVGITRDESLLDELLKCAFCKARLQVRQVETCGTAPDDLARLYHETFLSVAQELPDAFADDRILLGPAHIAEVDRQLSRIDFADASRDVLGDIYEAFVGSAYRGQEGQFFTPRNAIEALVAMVSPGPDDAIVDPACGAGGFLRYAAMAVRATHGADSTLPDLVGIDKDAYLCRLARIHLALQFGDVARTVCGDSLTWDAPELQELATNGAGQFSAVLTNPPFGARIVALTGDARADFELAYRWRPAPDGTYVRTETFSRNTPPQLLFLERCVRLLQAGGRLGIVLPESTLSNVGHRPMVQFLLRQMTPVAVIGMPEDLFKTSGKGGTHTKVCLLVAEKRAPVADDVVFMAEAKRCGHDSRGRAIDLDDLPAIIDRFQRHRAGDDFESSHLGFTIQVGEIRDLVLAPRYYDPEPARGLLPLAETHDLMRIRDLEAAGQISITTGHEVGKLAYGSGAIPFVRTSDISNWEVKVDPKHCVDQETFRTLAPKQDVRAGDILMVRDGTYLIGTCAMVTRHDEQIVIQSHLLKLRVHDAAPFDSHFLLAVLSSTPVQAQIRSLSFTQDIIDSLGDRIRDVLIPVPRDRDRLEAISRKVQRVIDDRVEARELSREVVREVVEPAVAAQRELHGLWMGFPSLLPVRSVGSGESAVGQIGLHYDLVEREVDRARLASGDSWIT